MRSGLERARVEKCTAETDERSDQEDAIGEREEGEDVVVCYSIICTSSASAKVGRSREDAHL